MRSMKTTMILAFLLLGVCALPMRVAAQNRKGDLGIGFIAGAPIGFSGKFFVNSGVAVDFAIGVHNKDLDGHADVLVHLSNLLPQPRKGSVPLYLGVGLKGKDEPRNLYGIRFLGGLAYHFPNHPLELFAEVAPVWRVAPDFGSEVDGGVGLRYYFSLGSKESRKPPKRTRKRKRTQSRKNLKRRSPGKRKGRK